MICSYSFGFDVEEHDVEGSSAHAFVVDEQNMWYRNSLPDEKEILPYIAQTNSSQDASGRLSVSDSPRHLHARLAILKQAKAPAFPTLAKALKVSQPVSE
jgi:hypothetical protein